MASIVQLGKKWRAQVRRKGFPAYCHTFDTKAQATVWAARVEKQIAQGRVPDARLTMGAFLVREAVGEYRRLRMDSRPIRDDSNEHYVLLRLERALGGRDATTLAVQDLVGFCRSRAEDGAGPYTINMDLGKLGTVLRLVSGVRQLNLPDVVAQARPVLHHLGLIGGGGRRERRPNDDELRAILDYMCRRFGRVYADFVVFAVLTAMRRAEICRIVWEDVDFERRMVLVRQRKHPRAKATNDEWVPLLGATWRLMLAQPARTGRVFPLHPQTVTKYFRQACLALGVPDLQLRDMRHDGVSRLFEFGYQIQEVALVSGHRKWETLRRYTQLSPQDLHRGPSARRDPAPVPAPAGAGAPGARPRP